MAISQKVGKGQFLPKVGRAVLYIYIFWAKHTAKLLNSIQLPAPNCSGGQLQRRNLQTMYREHRIQSNTSNLVGNPSWVSQDEVLIIQKLTMFAICTFKFSRKNILNRPMLTLESSFMCRFIDVPFQNSSIS